MGLGDLFKPKWKHSDDLIRRKAVEKINDQELIKKIAQTDEHEWVRSEAVRKLLDQKLIAEIAKNDKHWEPRQAAVQMLSEQKLLIEIARTDKEPSVRNSAVEKITDHNVLVMIAKSDEDSSVRKNATEKIIDQSVLIEIARKDNRFEVRIKAVANPHFNDQKILGEIAQNRNEDWQVRRAAVEKITDQELLVEILQKDESPSVRDAAKEKITDKKLLAELQLKCPQCGKVPNETKGSPVSPYINIYSCSCGWRKLKCGNSGCDGYMEAWERGYQNTVKYTCTKCGWSGTGVRFR